MTNKAEPPQPEPSKVHPQGHIDPATRSEDKPPSKSANDIGTLDTDDVNRGHGSSNKDSSDSQDSDRGKNKETDEQRTHRLFNDPKSIVQVTDDLSKDGKTKTVTGNKIITVTRGGDGTDTERSEFKLTKEGELTEVKSGKSLGKDWIIYDGLLRKKFTLQEKHDKLGEILKDSGADSSGQVKAMVRIKELITE